MIARLALTLAEYASVLVALGAAWLSGTASSPLAAAIACLASLVAAQARGIADSRARARHMDDLLDALRAGSPRSRSGGQP